MEAPAFERMELCPVKSEEPLEEPLEVGTSSRTRQNPEKAESPCVARALVGGGGGI